MTMESILVYSKCSRRFLRRRSNDMCKVLSISLVGCIYFTSLWHLTRQSCDQIIQMRMAHRNTSCILKDESKYQPYIRTTDCSVSVEDQRYMEIHFDQYGSRCTYCCPIFELNDGHKTSSTGNKASLRENRSPISTQASYGNISSKNYLTLEDIGIKKVFVINLDFRKDRLSNVAKLLGSLRLRWTRFEAISKQHFHQQLHTFNPKTKFIKNMSNLNNITDRIATWQSHLQIYFKIVDEALNNDEPVLILEDDFDMEANTPFLLKKALSLLPSDWEMFFLGHSHMECKEVYQNNICRAHIFYCAVAYVIRNSTVARKLINWSNTKNPQVADIYWRKYIRNGSLIVYAAYPNHIVIQNRKQFGSDIEGGGYIPPIKLRNPLSKIVKQ